MRGIMLAFFVAVIGVGCNPTGMKLSTAINRFKAELYQIPYASDLDFINLVNDDPIIREQARRHVFIYYNCLVEANVSGYRRQDPVIIVRPEVDFNLRLTFSEQGPYGQRVPGTGFTSAGGGDHELNVKARIAAFSEIPQIIYETRLEKLAKLITEHNKAAMQSSVEREIKELNKIKWDDIKKEVNLIVTGRRKAELDKHRCPIQNETPEHTDRRKKELPVFVPPFM